MLGNAARLGAAAMLVLSIAIATTSDAHAQGLKPYVVFDLDTSGSMTDATGAGPTTCGTSDNRLNHAKCAINRIANSYGDIVFALGRFRMTVTGTLGSGTCASDCVATGAGSTGSSTCNGNQDDRFELLTGLVDGENQDAAVWTDTSCGTCSTTLGSNPEIFEANGSTPIGGSLAGARRYYQGLQATNGATIWPSTSAGFNPIANDPLKLEYLVGDGSTAGSMQCRPYIVISLTDGGETCNGDAPAVATSLYDTIADGRHYRIETKAIGFGITPGTASIENLAIAGKGGTGIAGTCNATTQTGCDGYYASNEQELSLAISSILADTIRSETCDGADNDCDNEIDEDFPSLGDACDDGLLGECRGTGVFVCTADETGTECQITDPGAAPGTEVCNNLDDDCDGLIDELPLMCGGCGDAETCNGADDDCDGETDEDLVRPCGTDVGECTAGTEHCDDGMWIECTATAGTAEVCDGLDNDCDGVCDGFTQSCSTISGGNPEIGPCHEGSQICQALCSASGNSFGACLGEVGPAAEVCNCEDDDCDGTADDGTGGNNCDTTCGVGTTVCDQTTCALRCDSTVVPGDELECNGLDDDCDTMIDEDYVGGPCDDGGTICNGHLICNMGNEVCVGTTIGPEQCNCEDNDCDGNSDESGTCPSGSTCTSCQCAYPCDDSEFPCPAGKTCVEGVCLVDNCAGVTCPPDGNGDATVCIAEAAPSTGHTCEPACDHLTQPCPTGTICFGPTGQCEFDDCRTFPERCTADELCVVEDGVASCVADPCAGVTCDTEQYCLGGQCLASCGDVDCAVGERCELGECEPDPCGGPCITNYVCNDATGECVVNPCLGQACPGEACDPQTGECVADPCIGVTCPGNDICELGTCYDPSHFQPDAEGPEQHVTTGGGGGCQAGGGAGAGAGLMLALVALARALRDRRRRGGRCGVSRGAARVLVAVVVALAAAPSTSCGVSDYCLNCAVGDGGTTGDGGPPADGPDGGGPPPDACVPTGVELCDGFDNDCNGEIDDFPTDIGGVCGDPDPPCSEGTYVCNAGVRECTGVEPTAELCDDVDNNCNGSVDEGNPGGGASCGTNEGECVAGINQCIAGSVQCIGASGTPEDPAPPDDAETDCDGRDNDCDGTIDDGIVLGTCGTTAVGECELGTLQCIGGGPVCIGAIGPAFELCDDLDQDCDGEATNGFDLDTDRNNCMTCGHVCAVDNATAACVGGQCQVGSCLPGWHDANGDGDTAGGGDGCEYACDFQSLQEACNGEDEDCDGVVDEGVIPPTNFCRQVGECAGAAAACTHATGWQCDYGATVSTDGMGNIVPESTCDGLDNDCDGPVDESHPQKNTACNDGEQGACIDGGVYRCDTTDPSGPVVCDAVDDETMGTTETCNGIDDDCDGIVDNGHATGTMTGQEFVTVNGVNIMKYEASRPDATAAGQGTDAGWVCSRAGAVPWTNVTWPQAQDACEAIGARLCTEAEWEYTCSLTSQQQPVPGPTGTTDKVYLEAELGTVSPVVGSRQFTAYSTLADYGGNSAMQATPNSGTTVGCTATQEANAPRIDFNVAIQTGNTGNYYIWMRTAALTSEDNSLCAGVDGTASTTSISTSNTYWTWVVSPAFNITTATTHRFSVYMREDGTVIDAIAISRNNTTAPVKTPAWSYDVNPTTAQPNKCNTDPYDTNTSVAGDQDDVLPTGSVLTSCYANGSGANDVFDLTGNVREWTAPRTATVSALRGGASNTELNGATCQNDFVLGDDEFFFPNAGFRCCR